MGVFDALADLETMGKQVAEFTTAAQKMLATLGEQQTAILAGIEELRAGHATLHDENAAILGWLAEIDEEAETVPEAVEPTPADEAIAAANAEAAVAVAEADAAIATANAEAAVAVAEANAEAAVAAAESGETPPAGEAETPPESSPETPAERKEDTKLEETKIPEESAEPRKRKAKRTFISV